MPKKSRKNPKQLGSSQEVKPADQWINSSLVNATGLNHLTLHTTNLNAATVDIDIDQILEEGYHLLNVLPPLPEPQLNIPQVDANSDEEGRSITSPPPSCFYPQFHVDEFWGTMCGCSSRTPQLKSVVWDHCEFLRKQGIFFYPYLGFFVCTTHGFLVHPFHLRAHLNGHNLRTAVGTSRLGPAGWLNLMEHIRKSFKVIVDAKKSTSPQHILNSDWSTIDAPVPGLPIVLGFKCTLCGWLLGTRDSLNTHHSQKHKQSPIAIMESSHILSHYPHSRVYIQKLFPSSQLTPPLFPLGATRCYFEVTYPHGAVLQLQPSTLETQFSSKVTHPIQVTTLPSYISTLGWVEWLERTKLTKGLLMWLVATPEEQRVSEGDEILGKVEHGLWETSQLLKEYLKAADERLETMAPGIRDLIRGQFQQLKESTRNNYRLAIMDTISLLIRIKLLRHIKRAPEGLKIYVSQDQINARNNLFNLYLSGAKQSELQLALHTLLVSILCHSTTTNKLACPTDYSMCLACLKKGDAIAWNFKSPSQITGKFAQLQFCFRMVYFTHCYTISCNVGTYKPLLPPSSTTPIPPAITYTHPKPPYSSSILWEIEEQKGNEVTLEVIGTRDSQPLRYEDEEEIEIVGDEQSDGGLVQTLVNENKWLAIHSIDTGVHTPFNRLKRNWVAVFQASISETTNRIHSWSPSGDILTLVTTHSDPMKIDLHKIKPAVDSLFSKLAVDLTSLLPGQMGDGLPPEPKWNIQDTLGATQPFIDQEDFLAMISPLYTKFNTSMRLPNESHHHIWSHNGIQLEKFSIWLELEQKVLKTIFLILLFTGGGVSPRALSIAALQYCATTSHKRNLYLLHGTLCFAWPKAKSNSQSSSDSCDSLYAYPPQLNWLIFIYLGVIRRFTIEVLEEQKWSLGEIKNKLFVHTWAESTRGFPWKAAFMNTILGDFSKHVFDSQPKVSDFRQLTQSIYSLHFQRSKDMEGLMEVTANRMGNHTKGVSTRYYGRSNLAIEEWSQLCLACSRAWHCWLGLIPYDTIISLHLGDIPILQRHRNQVVANLSANIWIKEHKGQVLQVAGIQEFLGRLLAKNTPEYKLLCQITTSILWGGEGAPFLTCAPISGLRQYDVGLGVSIIVNQLQEHGIWDGTELCDTTVINGYLEAFERGSREKWEQLARDVWEVGSILGQDKLKQ
ncbi:hypothetical protein BDM02DRAFT_3191090 [Thelephora ganbajun]|uniref:Uncharacterized protein n=1 Tax=Thelephora ganbajun TaxID=370292 RepID=A0ACB6Z348_THEGA|nr:hypothetical protein BDM02DRAFT_3191090 [Thelephora ganbajun]